jgi:hypothetical protein
VSRPKGSKNKPKKEIKQKIQLLSKQEIKNKPSKLKDRIAQSPIAKKIIETKVKKEEEDKNPYENHPLYKAAEYIVSHYSEYEKGSTTKYARRWGISLIEVVIYNILSLHNMSEDPIKQYIRKKFKFSE